MNEPFPSLLEAQQRLDDMRQLIGKHQQEGTPRSRPRSFVTELSTPGPPATLGTLNVSLLSESVVDADKLLASALSSHETLHQSLTQVVSNFKESQSHELTLVPLDSLHDEHTSQAPVTLLEKPLLNLYVVTCEDNDSYKTNVKKQIKDWHSVISQRENQVKIIVHVVRSDIKTTDRKFFNMKSSVLDKIKADLNIDKRDRCDYPPIASLLTLTFIRCVQLSWTAGDHSPVIWADLVNKIKDGLLSALDSSVSQREEELRLMENLASSFEGVKLFEDALHQYNELEVSFIQVLREKNMSWFGSFIQPVDNDDSMPLLSLLSITKKHYRDLILANSILYLLARQCALLNRMRRPSEICHKVTTFLGTFGRRSREAEAKLPEYFIESWIFSSALSVVDQGDAWAPTTELDGIQLARFTASKGELFELAKTQFDIMASK
ncbi:hypothetical protein EV702DRAFT_1204860 [Suillus placidus]|uniref:TRAPPC10/Trs130 N-terminal domain-containing protein n=1 Tax=Suillus placidus TaxID=48579 RepID=A0A9P6ZGM1_9AGAM|nr:hypothetical protein EV702DRAFT_1204860 [Suillus placidus]